MSAKSDKENIQSILSELRKVLSDLTQEEEKHVEKKISELEKSSQVSAPSVPSQVEQKEEPTVEKPKEVVQPQETAIPQQEVAPEPFAEVKEKAEAATGPFAEVKEKAGAAPEPSPEVKEKAEAAPEPSPEVKEKAEVTPELPAEIKEKLKKIVQPAETEVPEAPTEEPVTVSHEPPISEVVQPQEVKPEVGAGELQELSEPFFIPPISGKEEKLTCPIINFAIFSPKNETEVRENFIKNMSDIIKKTSKKPFYFKGIVEQKFDNITDFNWDNVVNECVEKNIQAVFLISSEKFDFSIIASKFNSAKISFHTLSVAQLSRRITYIDFVIELMLKKKLI